jgi:hypothetical protein
MVIKQSKLHASKIRRFYTIDDVDFGWGWVETGRPECMGWHQTLPGSAKFFE